MDPFSHLAFGAAVAQGGFHRQLGWRAAALGALAAAAPDIDVVWMGAGDEFDALWLHRGITHSLVFQAVVGPALGWLVSRAHGGRHPVPWMLAITLALWSHALLDYITPYGTQLLLPFSDRRLAVAAMPIIDPAFTAILAIGLAIAWRLRTHARSGLVSLAAALLACGYVGYAAHLNDAAARFAAQQLADERVATERVDAYPTILQVFLRRVVARTPAEDRVGYVNMWSPCPIRWGIAPRVSNPSIELVLDSRQGRIFEWFAMGQVAAGSTPTGDGWRVRIADLRYGIDLDPLTSVFAFDADVGASGLLRANMVSQVALAARERIVTAWDNVPSSSCGSDSQNRDR